MSDSTIIGKTCQTCDKYFKPEHLKWCDICKKIEPLYMKYCEKCSRCEPLKWKHCDICNKHDFFDENYKNKHIDQVIRRGICWPVDLHRCVLG